MKVNHRIVRMRLPLRRIVSGVVEFLEVGFINVARDVLAVETAGIKGRYIRRGLECDIDKVVKGLVEQPITADGLVNLSCFGRWQ